MAYVDGFLLAVPTRKLDAYRRLAAEAGKLPFDVKRMSYGGFKVLVDM
ncbi:MAG TPA: DUF1428 family protein [Dongiaceae bacterium]|jgi:uncharacterized protein YbaA (DUF1428 family)|nr:DUF1428 family protein [Dongiaceae bacterium]